MKKNDITKLANAELVNLIAEGFSLAPMLLTGSYSDVEGNHTVLAKGDEVAIIWLERGKFEYAMPERITLHIARFDTEGKPDYMYNWPSDWREHSYKSWALYRVDRDWYVESEAEAMRCGDISRERHLARYIDRGGWLDMTDELWGITRKLRGFKTAKRHEVRVRKASNNSWVFENTASGTRRTVSA